MFKILSYISAFSVIVPIGLSVINYKYFNSLAKVLFLYLLASLLTEVVLYFISLKNVSTAPATNIFSLAEYGIIAAIYYLQIKPTGNLLLILIAASFLTGLFFVFGNIDSSMILFNSWYTLVLIAFALFYIFKEDKELSIPNLMNSSFYWFNSGFLLYFGTSFFLILCDDFIVSSEKNLARYLWTIQLINNIIYYAVLSVGIWKIRLI